MAKLKQYEIDAIVDTIVSKIEAVNATKIPSHQLEKQIDEANKALKKAWDAKEKVVKEYEALEEKYEKSLRVNCINEGKYNGVASYKFHVNNDFKNHKIRTEITMSSITDKNIESVIEKLVEKYTK